MKSNIIKFLILSITALSFYIPNTAQASIDILDIDANFINNKSIKISWRTNVETYGKVLFGTDEDNLLSFVIDQNPPSKNHEAILGNLKPDTKYYYQISANTAVGTIYSYVLSFETSEEDDIKAPTITDQRVAFIAGNYAVITWKTDENANSKVEYGIDRTYTKATYGKKGVKEHTVVLKNLKVGTKYYIRISATDKEKNQSAFFAMDFITRQSNEIDLQNLAIDDLRPTGPDDTNIYYNRIKVTFTTNHYAKAEVKIKGSGVSQTIKLNYANTHVADFTGLNPESAYEINIYVEDLLGRKKSYKYNVSTKAYNAAAAASANQSTSSSNPAISCSAEIFKSTGLYGQYYATSQDLRYPIKTGPMETGYYDAEKFDFARIDNNLAFGKNFYARGTKNHFSGYWRAVLAVPKSGEYSYSGSSDDNLWIYIDGQPNSQLLAMDGSYKKPVTTYLQRGLHTIEVYFVFRGRSGSNLNLDFGNSLRMFPLPPGCSALDASKFIPDGNFDALFKTSNTQDANSGEFVVVYDENSSANTSAGYNSDFVPVGDNTSSVSSDGVVVLGASTSVYTPAKALYKKPGSPDVFALMNGHLHYISSPASFQEYGYNWQEIQNISAEKFNAIPRARLIKGPNSPTIYFLYQKPENQWLKIALNSPTVFISYPGNYWGNVITVNNIDINNYPNVKLIKTTNNSDIYYLDENDIKHKISDKVFKARGFNPHEVAEVNEAHLESYITGDPLR